MKALIAGYGLVEVTSVTNKTFEIAGVENILMWVEIVGVIKRPKTVQDGNRTKDIIIDEQFNKVLNVSLIQEWIL
jgi:hypothetical protein